MLTDHHDGYGLNESLEIEADARDPNAGGASHHYTVTSRAEGSIGNVVAIIQFQHGPRYVDGSAAGITEGVLLTILIDRLRAFHAGPYSCRENAIVLTKLEESLMWVKERAHARAKRGVLGKNEK